MFPKAFQYITFGQNWSTSTGRKYTTQTRISCTSSNVSNVIYLIQCNICKKQYVGQTKNKILVRLNQHYSTIRNNVETPVSKHFRSYHYKEPYPIRIFILSIKNNVDNAQGLRNKWKRIWMARLNSYIPCGMNIQDNSNSFSSYISMTLDKFILKLILELSSSHTPKYLEKFSFGSNLHNRAHFCETIERRGSNIIFLPKLHIKCLKNEPCCEGCKQNH